MAKETIETFTVEKYKKMKAGNATDGAIISLLGTYPTKFIAWKRENGLMADKPAEQPDKWAEVKKQVANANEDVQEVAQQAEEPKETNSSSVDYKAECEALRSELDERKNSYADLMYERNDLFDKAEDFKRSHDEVWKQLQSEKSERAILQNQLSDAEKSIGESAKWIESIVGQNAELAADLEKARQSEVIASDQHQSDIINKPNHYHTGGIDVIDFAEMKFAPEELKGFCRINTLKYVTRYDQKNGVQDLEKAKFYINKLIELEGES